MGTVYTTTLNLKCRKEHTCVACGAVYSYDFARKIAGRASTAKGAQKKAQKLAQQALDTQVDLHPCPACGVYQPDMIGQQRVKWHRQTLWVATLAFVAVIVLRATNTVQADTAEWLLVAVGVLAALQMLGKELKNFNANVHNNLNVAAERVAAGKIQHASGQAAEAPPQWVRMERSAAQRGAGMLLLIGILLLAGAGLMRLVHGWPINAQAYPPVVGPGDTTRIYMPDKIESLNGYWRGVPSAVLTVAGSGRQVSAQCSTNQNNWGRSISVDSDEEHNSSTPWVEMTLPQDSSLASKTVDCDIALNIEYPQQSGDRSFETENQIMSQKLTLHLASAGAGALYDQSWWGGGIAGIALILATCIALVRSARKLQTRAHPTKILVPAPAAPPVPPSAPAAPAPPA